MPFFLGKTDRNHYLCKRKTIKETYSNEEQNRHIQQH